MMVPVWKYYLLLWILLECMSSITGGSSSSRNGFEVLSKACLPLFENREHEDDDRRIQWDVQKLRETLQQLSKSQRTFKQMDGASHELYQRTQPSTTTKEDSSSAIRSAFRTGCAADGLFAAELCDFLQHTTTTPTSTSTEEDGTLNGNGGREIVLSTTMEYPLSNQKKKNNEKEEEIRMLQVQILILWEPNYQGGAGLRHGGMDGLLLNDDDDASSQKPRGRFLIVLMDRHQNDLAFTLQSLDSSNIEYIPLQVGLIAQEYASVSSILYHSAAQLVQTILPTLLPTQQPHNNTNTTTNNDDLPAIHIVGSSMAGGIGALAAAILDGTIPFPETQNNNHRHKKRRKQKKTPTTTTNDNKTQTIHNIQGFGQGRTSAVALGPPPCLSPNVKASYVTSLVHGDDIVCRVNPTSMDRLYQRTIQFYNTKNPLFTSWKRMSDTFSLTMSSIQSYAHGSQGEETKLALPGNVYCIKPRRYHNACSLHQVGGDATAKHQAWRAAILWQLNDILLSPSMVSHHSLTAYIHALDRVQLRSFHDNQNE